MDSGPDNIDTVKINALLASVAGTIDRLRVKTGNSMMDAPSSENTPPSCDEYVHTIRTKDKELDVLKKEVSRHVHEQQMLKKQLLEKDDTHLQEMDQLRQTCKQAITPGKVAEVAAAEDCGDAVQNATACNAIIDRATTFFAANEDDKRKTLESIRKDGRENLAEAFEPFLTMSTVKVTDLVSTKTKTMYRRFNTLLRDVTIFEDETQTAVTTIPREVATLPITNGIVSTVKLYDTFYQSKMSGDLTRMVKETLVDPAVREYTQWRDDVVAGIQRTLLTPDQVEMSYKGVELLTNDSPDNEEAIPTELGSINKNRYPVRVDYDKEKMDEWLNAVIEQKVQAVRSAKHAWKALVKRDKNTAQGRFERLHASSMVMDLFQTQAAVKKEPPAKNPLLSGIQQGMALRKTKRANPLLSGIQQGIKLRKTKPSMLSGGAFLAELSKKQGKNKKTSMDSLTLMRKGWESIESLLAIRVETTATTQSTAATGNDIDSVPLKDHPLFKIYFDMLSKKLPLHAVENRMVKDNLIPQWRPYFEQILMLRPEKGLSQDPSLYKKLMQSSQPSTSSTETELCETVVMNSPNNLRQIATTYVVADPPLYKAGSINISIGSFAGNPDGATGTVGPVPEDSQINPEVAVKTYQKVVANLLTELNSMSNNIAQYVRINGVSVDKFAEGMRRLEKIRDDFYEKLSNGPTVFNASYLEIPQPDHNETVPATWCTGGMFGKTMYHTTPKGEVRAYRFGHELLEASDAAPTTQKKIPAEDSTLRWGPSENPRHYLQVNRQYGVPTSLALFAVKKDIFPTTVGLPTNFYTVKNLVTGRKNPDAPIPYYATLSLVGKSINPEIPTKYTKDEFWSDKVVQNTSLGIVGKVFTLFQVNPLVKDQPITPQMAHLQLKKWTRELEFDTLEEVGTRAPAIRYLRASGSWLPNLGRYFMVVYALAQVEKVKQEFRLTFDDPLIPTLSFKADGFTEKMTGNEMHDLLTWKRRPRTLTATGHRIFIENVAAKHTTIGDDKVLEFLGRFSAQRGEPASFYRWLWYFQTHTGETDGIIKDIFQLPIVQELEEFEKHCDTQTTILKDVNRLVERGTSLVHQMYRRGMVQDTTTLPFKTFIRPGCNTFYAFHLFCSVVRDTGVWHPFYPSASADPRLKNVTFGDVFRVLLRTDEDSETMLDNISEAYDVADIQLSVSRRRGFLEKSNLYDDGTIWSENEKQKIYQQLDTIEYLIQQINNSGLRLSYTWGVPTTAYRALRGEDCGKEPEPFSNTMYTSGEDGEDPTGDGEYRTNAKRVRAMLSALFNHPKYMVSKRDKKTCSLSGEAMGTTRKVLGPRPDGWRPEWDQFVPRWKNKEGIPNGIGAFTRLNSLGMLKDIKTGNTLIDLDDAAGFLAYVAAWAAKNKEDVQTLNFKKIKSILPKIVTEHEEPTYTERIGAFLMSKDSSTYGPFFRMVDRIAHRPTILSVMRDLNNHLVKNKHKIVPDSQRREIVTNIMSQWAQFKDTACAPVPLERAMVRNGDRIEYLKACIDQRIMWEPNPNRDPPVYSPEYITPDVAFIPLYWIVRNVVRPVVDSGRPLETIGARVIIKQHEYQSFLNKKQWHADWSDMCSYLVREKVSVVRDFHARGVSETVTNIVTMGLETPNDDDILKGLVSLVMEFVVGTATTIVDQDVAAAIQSMVIHEELPYIDRARPEHVPPYVWNILTFIIIPTSFRTSSSTEKKEVVETEVDLTKYKNMLRVGIDRARVQQKMTMDGISETVVKNFSTTSSSNEELLLDQWTRWI